MPKIIFQTLWSVIQNKKEINVFLKIYQKMALFIGFLPMLHRLIIKIMIL